MTSGSAQQVTLNSAANSFSVSQITGKLVIIQPKATFENFTSALKTLDSQSGKPFGDAATRFNSAFTKLVGYETAAGSTFDNWQDTTAQQLSVLTTDQIVAAWFSLADQLVKVYETVQAGKPVPSTQDIIQDALNFAAAYAGYAAAERTFYEAQQAPKPVLSFEYDQNRPSNQPTNSTFRLIYAQTVEGWTVTLNGAASIYDTTPSASIPGASRLRDAQVGFEADHNLPERGAAWNTDLLACLLLSRSDQSRDT